MIQTTKKLNGETNKIFHKKKQYKKQHKHEDNITFTHFIFGKPEICANPSKKSYIQFVFT